MILVRIFVIIGFVVLAVKLASAEEVIRLYILDKDTKAPIAGAVVSVELSDKKFIRQTSKINGEVRFTLNEKPLTIHVRSLGYIDREVLMTDTIVYLEYNLRARYEVVVTAQRHSSTIQDVPVSVSSVSAREINERSPQSIDQALRSIPGVAVTEDQVSIRGSTGYARAVGSRVLFLMDGMPMHSADNGDIKFDAIPMMSIERVEVVKGAGSALYGSNALGGIINVITRNPVDSVQAAFSVNGGMYDEPIHDGWKVAGLNRRFLNLEGAFSTTISRIGILADIAYRRNEGYRLGDDSYKLNGFIKTSTPLSDVSLLTVSMLAANDDRGNWLYWRNLDAPLMPYDSLSAVKERIHSTKVNAFTSFKTLLSGETILTAHANVFYTNFTTDPLSANDTENPHSRAIAYNGDIQLSSPLSSVLFLTTGLTGKYQTVSSDLFSTHTGVSIGGYVQAELTTLPFIVTLGFRVDGSKYDDSKSIGSISPKFGISYHVDEYVSFRASSGGAFRAPTITEQYTDQVLNGFTVKPNPNLSAERSYSFEVGGAYRSKYFLLDGAIFHSTFTNLIEPQFVSSTGDAYIQFLNITDAEIYGHEEIVEYRPYGHDEMLLRVGYTYIYPYDKTKGGVLNFRSRHIFQARGEYRISDWSLSCDFRYLSKFESVDLILSKQVPNGDQRIDAYVWDARIGFDASKILSVPLKATFQVQNLLNYYYVEIVGNMAPLRSFSLRLETTL